MSDLLNKRKLFLEEEARYLEQVEKDVIDALSEHKPEDFVKYEYLESVLVKDGELRVTHRDFEISQSKTTPKRISVVTNEIQSLEDSDARVRRFSVVNEVCKANGIGNIWRDDNNGNILGIYPTIECVNTDIRAYLITKGIGMHLTYKSSVEWQADLFILEEGVEAPVPEVSISEKVDGFKDSVRVKLGTAQEYCNKKYNELSDRYNELMKRIEDRKC